MRFFKNPMFRTFNFNQQHFARMSYECFEYIYLMWTFKLAQQKIEAKSNGKIKLRICAKRFSLH